MRLSLSPDEQASICQSHHWSWLEISLLIMLSAAILRLGSDLAGQWRQSAERIGLVEAVLHASSVADYSPDPFGVYIPALDPAIIIDVLGKIPEMGDVPFGLPGGISDQPAEPGNQAPSPTVTPLPTQTPTSHASDPTGEPTATVPVVIYPTATLTPTITPGNQASSTPTRAVTITRTPTQTPKPGINPTQTPTRTIAPSGTPTRTVAPPTTGIPTTVVPPPTTSVPTTDAPPPTTGIPTTVVPPPATVTPPNRTPTPFATRNPTNALTPTALYTPGVTSAAAISSQPPHALLRNSSCALGVSQPLDGNDCLSQTGFVGDPLEHSFWRALIDLLHLSLGRGTVY